MKRFFEKARMTDACWEWTAHVNDAGYGRFKVAGRKVLAHRFSYEFHFGPIPEGLCVLHKCDNPGCINPRHLFLGTQADNVRDMCAKGRGRDVKGAANSGAAKLTDQKVREIRTRCAAGETQRAMAEEYGISTCLLSYIVNRKAWGHVT